MIEITPNARSYAFSEDKVAYVDGDKWRIAIYVSNGLVTVQVIDNESPTPIRLFNVGEDSVRFKL